VTPKCFLTSYKSAGRASPRQYSPSCGKDELAPLARKRPGVLSIRQINRPPTLSGYSGAEAAQAILSQAGIGNVTILEHEEWLGDHYDPVHRRLGLLAAKTGLIIMAAAWGVLMVFNLITLPVEFDASRRAKMMLNQTGFVQAGPELTAVSQVLNAAAWTYVAAFISSLLYLLWYLLPLMTGRDRE
jgi:Zn-dependent membrane protease YugP